MCGICKQLGLSGRHAHEVEAVDFNLDTYAGGTYGTKPILDQAGVIEQIDSGRALKVTNNVITYTFLDLSHLVGMYNNPNFGFEAGVGLGSFSQTQRVAAREAIGSWDELIPQTFKETNGLGADIVFANSADPAQAYAYYPGTKGWKFQSDVFVADPALNWTNEWFTPGGYGNTTLIHEIGHAVGLSHPGAYNGAGATTYAAQAEYAQDSMQYSIMSYWSGAMTGASTVNWTMFLNNYAQTPMLHDILTIQSKYGADTTTRTGDSVYGFENNTGKMVFDFAKNPFPYLSIYDAGGNDTLNLSGFNSGNFINLAPGSFSSVGQSIPTLAEINAARAAEGFGPVSEAAYTSVANGRIATAATKIAADTGVAGVLATGYDNLSIAYNTTIENAIGGSARDVIWGNDAANRLEGRGGNDVLNGHAGADTLIGGTGEDTFQFSHLEELDKIMDFASGDKIDFTKIDAIAGGTDDPFAFIGSAAFTNTAGQLRYANGIVEGDVNGDGKADFSVIIENKAALSAADFFL